MTRVSKILPAVLAACARVSAIDAPAADAGPGLLRVTSVEPAPGPVEGAARFIVRFSAPMDEGMLVAGTGRSETIVLAAAANAELAAAAISHGHVTAHERALFVPAAAVIAADVASLELDPDAPLPPGPYALLVASRLKDAAGHRLAGAGAMRFAFDVRAAPERPRLIAPPSGTVAPPNLGFVRAFAGDAGVSVVDADGGIACGPLAGPGEIAIPCAGLRAGLIYALSAEGITDLDAGFTVSRCKRTQAPQIASAPITARDTSVSAAVTLDWPAQVTLEVEKGGTPCSGEGCLRAVAEAECAPDPCAPPSFECSTVVSLGGLAPGSVYTARVVAADAEGHRTAGEPQRFATLDPLPRLLLSEVMAAAPDPSPHSHGQYVEILNAGTGSVVLDALSLDDGSLHPLLGAVPPLPVVLEPGGRALAVGGAFEAARYAIPAGVPVLRAGTQRLLGHGLSEHDPAPMRLLHGSIEIARFPGKAPACDRGASLQLDESKPEAGYHCGRVGGTPGSPP